jgi:hypothetical protein
MGWEFQDEAEVKKLGARKARWYAGWRDVDGRRHYKRVGSKVTVHGTWL